ncbi:hypothetical protein [Methylocapsa aurea]|uniref:hypothetical protein n=1 Tax=Methylocapsa aurea TaxID=663610 RepID=UPI0012EB799F|nr:hypothetical protein [Methylocapsa aurea]
MFGKIGSFLKEAALGFVEIVGGPFTSASPAAALKAPVAEMPPPAIAAGESEAGGAREPASADVSHTDPHSAQTPDPQPSGAFAAPDAALAPEEITASCDGDGSPATQDAAAEVAVHKSSALNGAEAPGSLVAQRYRTLKAEGLTPKQANEFSRSARKYGQFRTLSTTRPHAGAATYWDKLKDFDQKAAAHAEALKGSGASKSEIATFKGQTERARDLLIKTYLNGKAALVDGDAAFVRDIGEGLGFKEF